MQVLNSEYFSEEKIEKYKKIENKKVLIINTNWNEEVIDGLTKGAIKLLEATKIKYDILTVPGSYEIPLAIKLKANQYDGFITLGAIIKGDTYHFEAVSFGVTNEISKLMMDISKPISFGVLMVKNIKDALIRSKDDNYNKGLECAAATLDMLLI